MKPRRISNSPLIDPAVSALIIMAAVNEQDTTSQDHHHWRAAITAAAEDMGVPTFSLLRHGPEHIAPAFALAPEISFQHRFLFAEHVCPWSEPTFVDALRGEDRSILLFAGSWLEHQVLGTALHGLAEGYDVCVILDATPPRSAHAATPAQERLSQAGGTPVVISQVIHEWMMHTADPVKRARLQHLLLATMQK
ncbi:MAG: isochorismatase family protein [Hyphomonadaceae bacterium]|nr:isochorismatase family protein [Hyphomonadaceae bacterium]